MAESYFPFTLRLYGHVLRSLRNHNFTGLDLFYRIKDCWKERDDPHNLLLKPLEKGLPYKIGEWCFNTMFDFEGKSESSTRPYCLGLEQEDLLWFLEDVVNTAKQSGFFSVGKSLAVLEKNIEVMGDLYDIDEEQYWHQIGGSGRKKLLKLFKVFLADNADALSQMRTLYAPEIADRILHDRQLCSFIAETVMDIGFDGETVDGMRARWVEREDWPMRVKAILHARDRGKCAACAVDIVLELAAEGNIDHIFPISKGGCNDLVNLQLLCSACNKKKLDSLLDVATSVPQYVRRVPSIQK